MEGEAAVYDGLLDEPGNGDDDNSCRIRLIASRTFSGDTFGDCCTVGGDGVGERNMFTTGNAAADASAGEDGDGDTCCASERPAGPDDVRVEVS